MLPVLKVHPVAAPPIAIVGVPGSKSSAARLLIAAALAAGRSTIQGVPECEDIAVLCDGLSRLGVPIERRSADGGVTIIGTGGRLVAPGGTIDVRRSGTALRFLLPLVALSTGRTTVLSGDARLRERPVKPLVDALVSLGARIELGGVGAPVTVVPGSGLSGGVVRLAATASSQFVSALLLIAPCLPGGLTIVLAGEPASASYIALTVAHLTRCGIKVERGAGEHGPWYRVVPQAYAALTETVPPDASTASYLWALAAVTRGDITVRGLGLHAAEPDVAVARVLGRMGCEVDETAGTRVRSNAPIRGVPVDGASCPDGSLTIAAVAACAHGDTVITGLGTLRHKESDRLAALAELMATVGIEARVTDDSLTVRGGTPHGGLIRTHADHRLAMIGGVLGAVTPGIEIEAPHVVRKSCPSYWALLRSLGVRTEWVRPPLVTVIGFMGAGKSTAAALVGATLGVPVVEIDEVVVREAGARSVAEVFAAEGEAGFRLREHRALCAVLEQLAQTGGIVSTGGGVVEHSANGPLLRERSTVVHLQADFATIEARLGDDEMRPLWRDRARARALFEARSPRYGALADLVIATDPLSRAEVAARVAEVWCEGVGM